QGNRIRVNRPVGLEIEDREQDLQAAGVHDLSTGERPGTRCMRRATGAQSEGPRRRPRPGHGQDVRVEGSPPHLGRRVARHREGDHAVQGQAGRETRVRPVRPRVPRSQDGTLHPRGFRGRRRRWQDQQGRQGEPNEGPHTFQFLGPRLRLLVHGSDSRTTLPLGLGRMRSGPENSWRIALPPDKRSRNTARAATSEWGWWPIATAPNARAVSATWVVTRLSRAGRWPTRRTVITAQSSKRMMRWPRKSSRGDRLTRAFSFVCVTFSASATSPENLPSGPTISKIFSSIAA